MFKHKDINEYLKEKEDTTILLDVRTKEEYEEGHIPGSINVELDYINTVSSIFSIFFSVFLVSFFFLSSPKLNRSLDSST